MNLKSLNLSIFFALGLLCLPLTCAAEDKNILNPDLLTVSGRFEFTKAKGRLTETRLKLNDLVIDPEISLIFDTKTTLLKSIYETAISKSLKNYGHLSIDSNKEPVLINISLKSISYRVEEKYSIVDLDLIVTSSSNDPAFVSCLTYISHNQFKALRRESRANGHRGMGIFIMAISPLYAAGFLFGEFHEANQIDNAYNASRGVNSFEGVTPDNDASITKKYAYYNAMQLANIDLLHYLGNAKACETLPVQPTTNSIPPELITSPPPLASETVVK